MGRAENSDIHKERDREREREREDTWETMRNKSMRKKVFEKSIPYV